MDDTNKTFTVRQFKGIEQVVIDQAGSGYDEEIPPTIINAGTAVASIETAKP